MDFQKIVANSKKHHKKISGILAVIFVGLLVQLLSSVQFSKSVNFSITSAKEFIVKLDISLEKNYPPTCGCLDPKDGVWSGVSFASRYIQLHNGNDKNNTLTITASKPGPLSSSIALGGIEVKEFELAGSGDSDDLYSIISNIEISPKVPFTKKNSKNISIYETQFKSYLKIRAFGEFPVHSYNPSTASEVGISYESDPLSLQPYLQIQDSLIDRPQVWPISSAGGNFDGGMMELGGRFFLLQFDDPNRPNSTILLLIKVPFSVRLNFRSSGEVDAEPRSFKISASTLDRNEYEDIKQRRDRQIFYWSQFKTEDRLVLMAGDEVLGDSWQDNVYQMQMRLPAIPPENGFNLYGNMLKLSATGANGAISVGSKIFELRNSEFVFTGLSKATLMGRKEFMPLRLQNGGLEGETQFSGNGTINVGGENLFTLFDKVLEIVAFKELWAMLFALFSIVVLNYSEAKSWASKRWMTLSGES
jgi:hypothetical protein